jgi:hypothetical protein
MSDKKSLNKQIPSSITYPNPYAEGEVFTPSNVSIGQETIRKNIPLGLGMPQSPPRVSSAITPQNVIRNAGIQLMPEEPSDDSSNFLGSLIAQGITGIGTGLMGGDSYDIMRSANVFQNMRDRQANEKRAKLLTDPKSEESKRRRLVFEKALKFKIPEEYSYTDLNDPVVLQSIRDKNMQAIAPKGGIGVGSSVGQAKGKQQQRDEIDKEDVKKISAMEDLNNSIDNLIASVETHGRKYVGEESQNQEDLMYGIAASSGVIKGQGAMTESDIKFWQGVLSPSMTGDKQEYINRMKNKKSEYIKGITKSLELKGYTVKPDASGKYQIFDKNENYIGQY